jgi:hypothetical protein
VREVQDSNSIERSRLFGGCVRWHELDYVFYRVRLPGPKESAAPAGANEFDIIGWRASFRTNDFRIRKSVTEPFHRFYL